MLSTLVTLQGNDSLEGYEGRGTVHLSGQWLLLTNQAVQLSEPGDVAGKERRENQ